MMKILKEDVDDDDIYFSLEKDINDGNIVLLVRKSKDGRDYRLLRITQEGYLKRVGNNSSGTGLKLDEHGVIMEEQRKEWR